jgi:hypothetical protein
MLRGTIHALSKKFSFAVPKCVNSRARTTLLAGPLSSRVKSRLASICIHFIVVDHTSTIEGMGAHVGTLILCRTLAFENRDVRSKKCQKLYYALPMRLVELLVYLHTVFEGGMWGYRP